MRRHLFGVRAAILAGLVTGLAGGAAGGAGQKAPGAGRYRGDITDPATGDVIMRVAMQVPEKMPTDKHLGLILLFHGFRGHENNYIGLTVEALRRLQLLDRYVVISGKSRQPGWTPEDDEPVQQIVRWAQASYPIDPRRVFIFGSSNGARYVGRFGSAHPELVAGVVGYCGNYTLDPALKERPGETSAEWYFVHGGNDRPQNSRRACDQLKALGHRYIFRQMDGYGHTDIWDSRGHPDSTKADAVRDDWLLWLHALRNKQVAPTADEQKALATLREQLRAGKADGLAPLLAEAERIGGEPAGAVIVEALSAPDAAVRAAAARTTERTLYGPAVTARLAQLLRDESEEVRAAATRGLARAATWRNTEAQAALARLARSADVPSADRLRAIEALGRASRLPLLGNVEDGLLVWALVHRLDDADPKARAAAFAALAPGVPDSFGYKPDLPPAERTAAVEKWAQWCRERCGPAPDLPGETRP
jgi:hypothetical protein